LGDDLLSLALHGSWALGDFAPGRSDLDVLAVMTTDPTAATLAGLDAVHARLAMDFPEWNGRVEVDYVSAQAVQAVVQGTDESHLMIRISPGEPLHEVEAKVLQNGVRQIRRCRLSRVKPGARFALECRLPSGERCRASRVLEGPVWLVLLRHRLPHRFDPDWPIVTDWPAVIRGLRGSLHSSQPEFAELFGLGRATV